MPETCEWLPDRQLHVVLTLAHANAVIQRLGEILSDYLWPGPLRLADTADGDQVALTITSIAPIPGAVARYAADALTQLRAAVEHTLFAEVEHRLGRPLAGREVRQIEMPAMTRSEDFTEWVTRRRALAQLRDGGELVDRIRQLQPFVHDAPDRHPLRLLAEHTNLAKHRAPAVAAVRVRLVIPDGLTHQEQLQLLEQAKLAPTQPAMPGDVIARGPRNEVRGWDIVPDLSVQRPHTGTWHVLMNELGMLERWVRRTAVPMLVAGNQGLDELPAQLDTTVGHDDLRAVFPTASKTSGQEQSTRLMQARAARPGLPGILAAARNDPARPAIDAWAAALDAEQVLDIGDRLQAAAAAGNLRQLQQLVAELRREALDSNDS